MRYILNVDRRIKTTDEQLHKFVEFPIFVEFHDSVTEDTSKKFVEEFRAAENAAVRSGQEILPVTIFSYGGSVYAGLKMVDAIKNCRIPVATIAEGAIMSFGTMLFSCGTEGHRYISPNTSVMIHQVSSGTHGKVADMTIDVRQADKLNEKMMKMMAKNCGHHESYFSDKLKIDHGNSDWYLDADEAVKHNLANKIHVPTFTVDLSLKMKFE
jgi:ATP-dependent Clp endopeptidase proteolytic subunit ClpP